MIAGSALASRALGDVGRRDLTSAWGGPDPATAQTAIPVERQAPRRVKLLKP